MVFQIRFFSSFLLLNKAPREGGRRVEKILVWFSVAREFLLMNKAPKIGGRRGERMSAGRELLVIQIIS